MNGCTHDIEWKRGNNDESGKTTTRSVSFVGFGGQIRGRHSAAFGSTQYEQPDSTVVKCAVQEGRCSTAVHPLLRDNAMFQRRQIKGKSCRLQTRRLS